MTWAVEFRVWVATGVTSLAAFSGAVLACPAKPSLLGAVFSATMALYNLDGSIDAKSRGASPARRGVHLALSAIAMATLAVCATQLAVACRLLLGFGLLGCGLYFLPHKTRWAVKSVFGLKAPFVGFAVASACVLLPALGAGEFPDTAVVVWLLIVLGLCASVNALLFDLVDLGEDAAREVPTLPHVLGVERTRAICGVILAAILILLGFPLPGPERISFAKWGIASLVIGLGLGSRLIAPTTRKSIVALGIDGALLLPWLVLTLAS